MNIYDTILGKLRKKDAAGGAGGSVIKRLQLSDFHIETINGRDYLIYDVESGIDTIIALDTSSDAFWSIDTWDYIPHVRFPANWEGVTKVICNDSWMGFAINFVDHESVNYPSNYQTTWNNSADLGWQIFSTQMGGAFFEIGTSINEWDSNTGKWFSIVDASDIRFLRSGVPDAIMSGKLMTDFEVMQTIALSEFAGTVNPAYIDFAYRFKMFTYYEVGISKPQTPLYPSDGAIYYYGFTRSALNGGQFVINLFGTNVMTAGMKVSFSILYTNQYMASTFIKVKYDSVNFLDFTPEQYYGKLLQFTSNGDGTWTFNGAFNNPAKMLKRVQNKIISGNYTVTTFDEVLIVSTTATITIPTSIPIDTPLTINNSSASGTVTVIPDTGTIQGSSSVTVLVGQKISIIKASDNSWYYI